MKQRAKKRRQRENRQRRRAIGRERRRLRDLYLPWGYVVTPQAFAAWVCADLALSLRLR